MSRNYGWIPDVEDNRDLQYKSIQRSVTDIPDKVDMRKFMTPVEDQGHIGSCVANAAVGALEYLYVFKILKRYSCLKARDYSRLFVYWHARQLDGIIGDDGCTIRSAMKALADNGTCREKYWPYNLNKWSVPPSDEAVKEATVKASDYFRVVSYQEILSALADDLPVVFGAKLYESFQSTLVESTGLVKLPKPNEPFVGNHAMLAVGFDKAKDIIIVRNSWGSKWGMDGYCEMPGDYFRSQDLVRDCWVIRRFNG
jgi:C1A family cysteine protease